MKKYNILYEIAGQYACFTRPDTGDLPRSYACPTYSSVREITKAIAWWKDVEIIPLEVGICNPLRWMKFTTNYRGPCRKDISIKNGDTSQQQSIILFDVCYKIKAEVIGKKENGINKSHAFQEFFNRRIKNGRFFTLPFLGLRSMGAKYVGPWRENTFVDETIYIDIPIMYREGYLSDNKSAIYDYNVKVCAGVLKYVV